MSEASALDRVFSFLDHAFEPPGSSYLQVRSANPDVYPHFSQLWVVIPIAIGLFVLRLFVERFVFRPFALYMGLKAGKKKPEKNEILEKAFAKKKKPTEAMLQALAKETGKETKYISRWFTVRRNYEKPDLVSRFQEASWRLTYYTTAFVTSVAILSNFPWFSNPDYCWIGFEHQTLDFSIKMIYFIQLGFYVSLVFSQFTDIRRKDFWEMFIHHIATILLISLSYHINFIRIGTLVLLVHDVSDIFMEAAKVFKYLKYQKLCDIFFVIFAIVFFVSRLIIYPFVVIKSALVDSVQILHCGAFPGHLFFNFLLLTLQVLHIIWFSIIYKMAWNFVKHGEVEKDDRSDSEEEDETTSNKKKN